MTVYCNAASTICDQFESYEKRRANIITGKVKFVPVTNTVPINLTRQMLTPQKARHLDFNANTAKSNNKLKLKQYLQVSVYHIALLNCK